MSLPPASRQAIGLFLVMACGAAGSAWAQSIRTYQASRPLGAESRLAVSLELPQGTWAVGPAQAHQLYAFDASYQRSRYRPVTLLEGTEALRIGLDPVGQVPVRLPAGRSGSGQQGSLRLSPDVDLDLDVTLSGARTTLELGGLRLTRLRLRAGGGATTIRYSEPNGVLCAGVDLALEAGDLRVERFADSGCRSLRVTGGMGSVTLDFTGDTRADLQADLSMTVGELVLRIPRSVGVLVAAERFLTSFESSGLSHEGGLWRSPGYDQAARRIDLTIASTVGTVRVEWIDQETR